MDLVESAYRVTMSFPKHEIYGLTSQVRRAAVSIPANIAEGQSREHLKVGRQIRALRAALARRS
jgi:four helix bundle protein